MSNSAVSRIFESEGDAIAVALYIMRTKSAIHYEALPHGRVRLTVDERDAARLNAKPAAAYAYIQEGGSTSELYLHGHHTEVSAIAGRLDCALAGAYKTGAVVEIPPCLQALGEVFYETAQALVGTVSDLKYYAED